jgi:hypothetical protein
MTPEWLTATIAGASAIGGGLVVAASNFAISRRQAADAKANELAAAIAGFFYVLNALDHRLRVEPVPGRRSRRINDFLARSLPNLDYTTTRLRMRLLDPTFDSVADGFHSASARLFLVAPLELMAPLSDLMEMLETAETRDADWWNRWDRRRTTFALACRRAVGQRVVEARGGSGAEGNAHGD